MPVDAALQQKVLSIVGTQIENGTKIAARERFYELKLKEIELEKLAEQFRVQHEKLSSDLEKEITEYSTQLDKLMGKAKPVQATAVSQSTQQQKSIAMQELKQAAMQEPEIMAETNEEYFTEPDADATTIVTTAPQTQQPVGVKVRMQEQILDESEALTDEEVPIEFAEESA